MQKILAKFQCVIPMGAPNIDGVGLNRQFLTNILLYLAINGAKWKHGRINVQIRHRGSIC